VVAVNPVVDLRIDWLDAPRVSSPDLAATWAAYQLWIGNECVTHVETREGDDRRLVFGSLYPLAEWIAENWWSLTRDVRPSALSTRLWRWANSRDHSWLLAHNFRSAGNGMAWPDLSIVPEGGITTLAWCNDESPTLGGLKFLRRGTAHVQSDRVSTTLAEIVNRILDRLHAKGIPAGPLGERWAMVTASANDEDETEFCITAARLGLDPYAMDDGGVNRLVSIAERVPASLRDDFFNSAPDRLLEPGLEWLIDALPVASSAAASAERDVAGLRRDTARAADSADLSPYGQPAWRRGYGLAQATRAVLGVAPEDRFDVSPWVGVLEVGDGVAGLQGVGATRSDRCGLALPGRSADKAIRRHPHRSDTYIRFSCARALSISVSTRSERSFILSPVGTEMHRSSRAFAAELLAPAEGISRLLAGGPPTDEDIEDLADHFEVDPRVIDHQYENQLS
jgi:hypothetical protein